MKLMLFILTVLILSFLNLAVDAAELNEAGIVKIESGAHEADPALVYLDDGRVVRVESFDRKTLSEYKVLEQSGDRIRVPSESPVPQDFIDPSDYVPTDLFTADNAQLQFKKLNWRMRARSQCYQRAQNWAYEMWKSSSVQSMKNFMFFTRKYIRQYNYHWWFHVAPMVDVAGTPYVLDPTFTRGALTTDAWTSNFMPKNVTCAVVEKYSDYENHQEEQLCYHIRVPMYYYQPKNVQAIETGTFVTDWVPWELEHAARAYR